MKRVLPFAAVSALALGGKAFAQGASAEDANKSNNPLNPAPAISFQDYYNQKLYGSDRYTNDLLLRGTLPVLPGQTIKLPQIFRVTVPISTRPDPGGGYTTGLGDINLFDIFVLGKTAGGVEYGAGPLLTLPTASDDALGTGKWQAGAAFALVDPEPRGIFGALIQWQASFAGDKDRADVSALTLQPLVIHNLSEGWYLRSSGIWTFNLKNDDYYIPLGFGVGKVWKSGKDTFNLFAEPQWTVAHDGNGLPKFAPYFGLNVTLGR